MRILKVLAFSSLFTSCNLFWEYRGLEEFSNLTWHKSDIKSFDAQVSEAGIYDIYILFRHTTGFPYAKIGVNMSIDGDGPTLYEIPIIDESSREYLGEGSGDLWDVEFKTHEKEHLEPGDYHFELQHSMIEDELRLAMEVGVMIKKSE